MSIHRLIQLAAPPERPVANGTPGSWPAVFQRLQTTLPQDYVDFVTTYGSGGFYKFLGIYSPFSSRDSLVDAWERYREMFVNRGAQEFFPEKGGLLLCGGDENGDLIFWRTAGPPKDWTIVLCTADFLDVECFEMNLTGFLVRWLDEEIKPKMFEPWDVLRRDVLPFSPDRE